MLRRLVIALHLLVLASSAAPSRADYKDWVLPKELPPITAEQKALKDVPFAPGARAVILFEGEQLDWAGVNLLRATNFRRVKILTPAGIEEDSDYTYLLTGGWRVQKLVARTTLPDGSVVDATDRIVRERSDDGNKSTDDDIETIRFTFPQVEVGAILDIFMTTHADGPTIDPWTIQQRLPVLECRMVIIPPNGFPFRTAVVRLPPEAAAETSFRYGETHGHGWSFRNVPPLPDLPNMPPEAEVAQSLLVIYGPAENTESAAWKMFARRYYDDWEEWLRLKNGNCSALARQIAGEASTPRDKAEAIRKALRDRMSVSRSSRSRSHDNPDAVLQNGQGTSADLAGLTVAMLRAVNVPARLAATRLRSSGPLPGNIPIPSLLDDYLVVITEGEAGSAKDVFYSPGAPLPIGQLPWENSSVLAVPIDKDVVKPIVLPGLSPERNKTTRSAQASVDVRGNVVVQSVVTRTGVAAEYWRAELKGSSADAQRARVQEGLRGSVPGAVVDALQIEGLDDPSADLVVTCSFKAEGHATLAGDRLLLSPFLFAAIDPTDWSAETRNVDIDMGNPSWDEQSVMVQLPEGTISVRHPAPSTMNAGEAGIYETSFEGKGRALLCKRKLRLDLFRFPASNWAPLRKWFLDMAANDDEPIVIEMPAGT